MEIGQAFNGRADCAGRQMSLCIFKTIHEPGGADAPPSVFKEDKIMAFFNSAITVLQTLVVALGAGLGVWGAINLLEGYGNDNPGAKSQGMKHLTPKLM